MADPAGTVERPSPLTEEPLPEVLTCLRCVLGMVQPSVLLLHQIAPVCRVWRSVAFEELEARISTAVLAKMGEAVASRVAASTAAADVPPVSVKCVLRTPLLAYYGETLAATRRAARDAPSPGTLPGSDRSVPMVRITYAASVKPKDLLVALKKAAASWSLRGVLAIASDGEMVATETGLAPAGTSALVRRLSVDKALAGGAWLVAHSADPLAIANSRCAHSYTCSHQSLEGKAPDILAPAADMDKWTGLPPLSILAVRVATAQGFTEPQWEARESTSGTADSVRMIACEWRKKGGGGGASSMSVVLALDPNAVAAGHSDDTVCFQAAFSGDAPEADGGNASPVELRYYEDERSLLEAFECLVVEECDPDVLLTYDARAIGLVAERHTELNGKSKGAWSKGKGKGIGVMQLGREGGVETKVVSVVTYTKAWASRAGARQQTSENLEVDLEGGSKQGPLLPRSPPH